MSRQESSFGRSSPRAFRRAAALVIVAACLASPLVATLWIVDANNGPGTNFTTISAAVAAAQPGDRIMVRAATYGENVVVNKAVTIVGWNATTYPLTVPALPFADAVWGGLMVTNIPPGQTCVVSGLVIARPSSAGGTSVALLNSPGTIVLDRTVIPNGGLYVSNCSNVVLEGIHVRHLPGELPPTPGLVVDNSWVQANDLDATGGDLETDPGFYPAAANAFEAWNQSVVALARPKLIGGFGGGPWVTSTASPAGGAAILCVGSVVSIADEVGSASYLVGGQGGLRGVGSLVSIPSGNGGSAVEVRSAGIVVNKKPLALFGGAPGLNVGGGPIGAFGAGSATSSQGVYAPIADIPALYRSISGSVAGGFWIFSHHAAAPLLPVAVAIMPDVDLDLYPPSLQFSGGNPLNSVLLFVGQANGIGYFQFGTALQPGMSSAVGVSVVIQTADDTANTLFLANPSMFVLGF